MEPTEEAVSAVKIEIEEVRAVSFYLILNPFTFNVFLVTSTGGVKGARAGTEKSDMQILSKGNSFLLQGHSQLPN